MGMEGEEVQAKRKQNIFNKIVTEIFTNLQKVFLFRYRKPQGHQTDLSKIETPQHIITKTTSTENKERILKVVRERKQIMYKGITIKMIAGFSKETLKTRKAWSEVFYTLNESNFNLRILYPAKLSFKIDEGIDVFETHIIYRNKH
jgi:hypothetical protein